MKRHILTGITLALSLLGTIALPAYADHGHGGGRDWHGGAGSWHGRDIRAFHDRDFGAWRGGRWYHGYHGGRLAWWWLAGGVWYFYNTPVYPYPDPYQPPVVVAPQPAAQVWYYCDAYQTYYPYVPDCPSGWRAVPATP